MRQVWLVCALGIGLASAFALGYAVNGLADGVAELPRHWWSTAPVLGLVAAAVFGILARFSGDSSRP